MSKFKRLLCVVALVFASINAISQTLEPPRALKEAAAFVWYLAKSASSADDLRHYDAVDFNLTDASEAEVREIIIALRSVRHALIPEVALLNQRVVSPQNGEQIVIFGVFAEHHGSSFVQLHIIGRTNRRLVVRAVQRISAEDVIKLIAEKKIVSFRQDG